MPRSFMKKLISVLAATLALPAIASVPSFNGAEFVPGEVIVKFKSSVSQKSFSRKSFYGAQVKSNVTVQGSQFSVLKIENKSDLASIIYQLEQDSNIEYAEPNFIYRAIKSHKPLSELYNLTEDEPSNYTPAEKTNDPKFDDLWGLHNTGSNAPKMRGVVGNDINALKAWGITKGSKRVKIAVIDTGIDYNHEDLKDNMWTNQAELNGVEGVDDDGNGYVDDIHGYDFANNDGDPMDGNGHGTHCAGTIAGVHDNEIGVAGVMAQAELVGVKFLTDSGSGTTEAAIKAIEYATKIGVDIMSNSWGGGGSSAALKEVIQKAHDAGIVFTAAAGNSGTDNNSKPHYPSNYDVPNVISVAASQDDNTLASFSCYGSRTVHVAAPGHKILSTFPNDTYRVLSGTSMATPHVTGVVGLYLAMNEGELPEVVKEKLMESSIYNRSYGKKLISGGRVDAYNFLTGVVSPRPERPKPSDWNDMSVDLFESAHPYPIKVTDSITYSVPGAKFIRVKIKKFELENKYDTLSIKADDGTIVEKVSGKGEDYFTEYVEGENVTIDFKSDMSVVKWGYVIEEIQYIMK